MQKPRTHYDNLKVTRLASPQEIRAAYKKLALQFHPDRNPKSRDEANRIMQIINASYAVLSDPARRAAHDQWVISIEASHAAIASRAAAHRTDDARAAAARAGAAKARAAHWDDEPERPYVPEHRESWIDWRALFLHVSPLFALLILGLLNHRSFNSDYTYTPPPPDTVTRVPEPRRPEPRPESRPNRPRWMPDLNALPKVAAEIARNPALQPEGPCTVTIDNSQGTEDLLIRLIRRIDEAPHPTRHIYLPTGASFTSKALAEGVYELRYKNVSATRGGSRSMSFDVATGTKQGEISDGTLKVTVDAPLEKPPTGSASLERGL